MNKISTGMLAALTVDGSIKDAFDNSEFRLYSGIEPDSADDSIGGANLLCVIRNGASGVTFEVDSAGVLVKPAAENWQGTNAASGVATWYRLLKSDDTNAASTTAIRLQGSVGVIAADLNLADVNLVSGAPQQINHFVVTLLAA